jgi:acyl-CoA synthetase (AMP-forming)/AMP-acid ligase II/acyl carrier protein
LRTLVDVARWRAETEPDQPAFFFLADGEHESGQMTYGALDRQARAIADGLRSRGAQRHRVLLLCEPGEDFTSAFYGCLYAGALAVPAYPPDPLRLSRTLPRLRAILDNAQARFVLGSREILEYVTEDFGRSNPLEVLPIDRVAWDGCGDWLPAPGDDRKLAFLQYTSGSTRAPRGIMLTHGNVMSSVAAMHREDMEGVVGVIWLPPYHDMGLLGGVLLPVYSGRPIAIMPPRAFIERPIRWIQAISRYRATTTGAPNFAFELCVRKARREDCKGLDLSCWKIAVVGAEPVRAETLDRFTETFAPYGFRRETFLPAYGLAEATLNVTAGRWFEPPVVRTFSMRALEESRAEELARDDRSARRLVGCGRSWDGQRVAIVDPKSRRELAAGRVGEIWVQSPNVAKGYWNRPKETARTFAARLAGSNHGTFLRTGDLGFLHDGELFVVGRLKELIILGGRNYYPQDIEQVVARSHPSLKRDAGAAFSCEIAGRERLVIVQEARRSQRHSLDDVIAGIRRELVQEYLISPYAVVLIAGGTLPKTSSGKPRRRYCRRLFLDGRLECLAEWRAPLAVSEGGRPEYVAPRTPLEERIAALWSEVLRVERVGIHDNFFTLGGDSLLATELYLRLSPLVPGELPLEQLFERPTVAGLAELVLSAQAQQEPDPGLTHLLDQIEGMTEEEADASLAAAHAAFARDDASARP